MDLSLWWLCYKKRKKVKNEGKRNEDNNQIRCSRNDI